MYKLYHLARRVDHNECFNTFHLAPKTQNRLLFWKVFFYKSDILHDLLYITPLQTKPRFSLETQYTIKGLMFSAL